MRKNKFRLWNPKSGMSPGMSIPEIIQEAIFHSPLSIRESHAKDLFTDVIFLQFTGLHDKNGVEIWEGDVVKEIPELSGDEYRKRRGVIEWDEAIASFVVKLLDRIDGAWCQLNEGNPNNPTTLKYTEVLGNIYENPELLEP